MSLNLRQMEVFRAVMREGSVTGAAKSLNVSQPSISEILRHSELRLGFLLFDRTRGRLKPTEAAKRLYAGVERVFDEVANVNRTALDLRESHRTLLRIGSVSSLAMVLGPSLVAEFQRDRPHVNARLSVMKRAEMVQDLRTERIEIGLTFLSSSFAGIRVIEIARRPMLCIVPVGHALDRPSPATLEEIARYPVIAPNPPLAMACLIRRMFEAASHSYAPVAEVEQFLQAWSLVQSGLGVSIVEPFSSVDHFFPGVRAVPLACRETVPLQLLVAENRADWRLIDAFVAQVGRTITQRIGRECDAGA